jgi:DNA-binding transcriptional MerR regulator
LVEIFVLDEAQTGPESLHRRLNRDMHLRPIDLARTAGLGVSQIRTYERVGFLPPAERGANGYRRYTEAHVEALRVARIVIAGYGWQHALAVLRAVHAGDRAEVFTLVNARHAALDQQHTRLKVAVETTEAVLNRQPESPQARVKPAARIREAAATVGVRTSALRFWEQQGLLHPERDPATGYRRYDADQLARLNVIALLRDVDYNADAIRSVLDELASGRPDQIRQALEDRLETLHQTSWLCITATSTLHAYLETFRPSTNPPREDGTPTTVDS